jgi:hypothetical protein
MTTANFPKHSEQCIEMQYAAESISAYFSNASDTVHNVSQRLSFILPRAIAGFKGFFSSDKSSFVKTIPLLDKKNQKLITILGNVPYTSVRELKAYVPEGMCVTYAQYLEKLLVAVKHVSTIHTDTMQPFATFLGELLGKKDALFSLNDGASIYAKMQEDQDAIYASFNSLYKHNSHLAEVKVGQVIERNTDWFLVVNTINDCVNELERVNVTELRKQIDKCVELLDKIYAKISDGSLEQVTPEVTKHLAVGAYAVAKELELYSTVHYQLLAIHGCVENTILHLAKTME